LFEYGVGTDIKISNLRNPNAGPGRIKFITATAYSAPAEAHADDCVVVMLPEMELKEYYEARWKLQEGKM